MIASSDKNLGSSIRFDTHDVELDGVTVQLKHLDKFYDAEIQKIEVIDYYMRMAKYILPHIQDKPFSMIHFPHGVGGEFFYQKQSPKAAPDWLKTVRLASESRGAIDWCLCSDAASIVYMANRSVIEMHSWFSRLPSLEEPDIAVIDLDPSGEAGFNEARFVACAFEILLLELGIYSVPKTSGGSGIHICLPIKPTPFERVREFLLQLCRVVAASYPAVATLERSIKKRGDRVYLDAVQNAYAKTIVAPYSLRARQNLPVATPLEWQELKNPKLAASDFNIRNLDRRLKEKGDLMDGFYAKAQILPKL